MKQIDTPRSLTAWAPLAALAAALALSACGGGGGAPLPDVPEVRFETTSDGGIRDNTTGITWAAQLGGEGLPRSAGAAYASELLALTTLDPETLSLNFPFVTGKGVVTQEAPSADQPPLGWIVDFGVAGDPGTLALQAAADVDSWYVLSRTVLPETITWSLDESQGIVTGGGLMWKVCSEGSAWQADTKTCSENQVPWAYSDIAAQVARNNEAKYAGHTDWRLPSKQEVQALIQLTVNRAAPRANLMPDAFQSDVQLVLGRSSFPVPVYWTSSFSRDGQQAWEVDFSGGQDGGVSLNPDWRNSLAYLRLVRTQ